MEFFYLGSSFCVFILLGVIFYGFYGSNNPQTIINKLLSSFCISLIEYFAGATTVDIIRIIVGPLPKEVCYLTVLVRLVFHTESLLLMNTIMIAKYVLIFVIKNPLAFDVGFWGFYLHLIFKFGSYCFSIFALITQEKKPIYFYMCSGLKPPETEIALILRPNAAILVIATIVIHTVVGFRIKVYKMRGNSSPENAGIVSKISFLEMSSFVNLTMSIVKLLIIGFSSVIIEILNRIPSDTLILYPYYFIELLMRFWIPPFSFTFLASMIYVQHRTLREYFVESIKRRSWKRARSSVVAFVASPNPNNINCLEMRELNETQ